MTVEAADHDRAIPDKLSRFVATRIFTLLRMAAERSPFYRDRLAGVVPDSPAALTAVRPLTRAELLANSPPESEALLTGPAAHAYVFRSGGTTGAPKFSLYAASEFQRISGAFVRTYRAAGLVPADRAANLFVCGQLYASFVFVNRMLEEMGCLNFPMTAAATPETVSRYVELFGINTLMGVSSWVLEVVGGLSPAAAARIEKIFYAGEHLYPEERAWLGERLPNLQLVASGGYGAVDTGLMGYQCRAVTGGVHHILPDHAYLEFVHPETGRPVPAGDPGLILVTMLDRELMPVIRYQIGDEGRQVPGSCPCGRTAPRFELLGRGDDTLRIGYASLGIEEVLPAVAEVVGLSTCAQLIKEREDRKDRLTVLVEWAEEAAPGAQAAALKEALYRRKPDLAKMEEAGYIWPTVVEVVPPGGVARNPLTGKVRRTLDRTAS